MAAFLAGGCSGLTQGEAQAPDRPNVVLILADDMRADDFEYMPQTRRLLTEEGVTFEETFVTHSLCCPSRTSILRGQYTHNHQVWKNARPEGGFEKFRSMGHEDSNVATWLQSEGYQMNENGAVVSYAAASRTTTPTCSRAKRETTCGAALAELTRARSSCT